MIAIQSLSDEQKNIIRSLIKNHDELSDVLQQLQDEVATSGGASSKSNELSHCMMNKISEKNQLAEAAKASGLAVWDKAVSVVILPVHDASLLLNEVRQRFDKGLAVVVNAPQKGNMLTVLTESKHIEEAKSLLLSLGYLDLDIEIFSEGSHPNAILAGMHDQECVKALRNQLLS